MKKPDFSKAAIQKFFLYHSEKLILLLAMVLLGLFFWMGLKTEVFSEKSPDELVKMAETADRHIRSPASWDSIKDLRKGNHDVVDVIKNSADNLKPEKFNIDPFTGVPAQTAETRTDPVVFPVIESHATTFMSPMIVAMGGPIRNDPFAEFPRPESSGYESGMPSGFGALSQEEAYMQDPEYDEIGEPDGSRSGRGRKKDKPEEVVLPEMAGVGTEMRMVHVHEALGMRPPSHQISSATSKSYIYDVVCVTGLVDFKQLWNSFNKSFSSSMGYYPDRDKPIFQYLQVERREVDDQGNPLKTIDPKTKKPRGEWSDQSEMISHRVPMRYPEMHRMPNAMYSSAPDIVAPNNYDPVLTGPIPPVVMFDYLPYVIHPKLAEKIREFPDFEKDEEFIDEGPSKIFQKTDEELPGLDRWSLARPRSPMRTGQGLTGIRSPLDEEGVATRNGSDFTDYWKALEAKTPTDDYRLVRFFDVLAKRGRSYEYRMRVWVGDPNNEDVEGTFAKVVQGGLAGGRGTDFRRDMQDESDYMAEMEGYDPRGLRKTPSGTEFKEEPEKMYVKTPILGPMTHPTVRIRLNRAREVEDPKTREISYFVSELRGKDAEGKDIFEEVAVPNKHPYLRFARPSDWSQPVRVTVANRRSQVAAGGVEPPKTSRLKIGQADKSFPVTEPMSEVVVSVWSNELGTAMPTRQKVYRGDALDFNAPSYIMHPITWEVLIAKNTSPTAEGGAEFLFDIDTGNVVVDAMGGGELPLPYNEKMRHALPSEVLVMDEFGEFHVQNDLADKTVYRNLLFLADESQIVGRPRAPKKKKEEEMEERLFGSDGRDF